MLALWAILRVDFLCAATVKAMHYNGIPDVLQRYHLCATTVLKGGAGATQRPSWPSADAATHYPSFRRAQGHPEFHS